MGLGEIFDANLTITPGADGSFIVYTGMSADKRGFTNVTDLMTWLQRAAQAQQAAEVMTLNEKQVVQGVGGAVPGQRFMTKQDDIPLPDGYPTRRTTALGSLADRMAAADAARDHAGTPKGAA